jgi:Sec-independent protein translocase protein TatA
MKSKYKFNTSLESLIFLQVATHCQKTCCTRILCFSLTEGLIYFPLRFLTQHIGDISFPNSQLTLLSFAFPNLGRYSALMPHPAIAFLAPGGGEMIVVMLALLLLFGPKDAPRILRKIQDALRKLQHAASDFKNQILASDSTPPAPDKTRDTAVYDQEKPPPPPPADGPPP